MPDKPVVILSDIVEYSKEISPEEKDTLEQTELVYDTLKKSEFSPIKLKFEYNTGYIRNLFDSIKPLFVFNLVEDEADIIIAPMILENLGIKYTGCTAEAIYFTTNKLFFKKKFKEEFGANNIVVPGYVSINDDEQFAPSIKYILKSASHHSSVAIDDSSVISPKDITEMRKKLVECYEKYGKEFFAEEYIDGREFNVSVLNKKILPVAEIVFKDYPQDKVKIVGYKAKWDNESFEYSNTVRTFDFSVEDEPIINNLRKISEICLDIFNLSGYARLDFRIDGSGIPYLLEINTNPCLSIDAGFYASCMQAGMNYENMINKIINSIYTPQIVS